MKRRRTIFIYLFLIALAVGSIIARSIILKGLQQTKLGAAPPLSGVVSQSLANLGTKGALPVEGKDYVLQNVRYFDNQTYAVVSVKPIKKIGDSGTLVLQKINGFYQVVLGPGTAFPSSDIQSLPAATVQYLKSQVLIYAPAN